MEGSFQLLFHGSASSMARLSSSGLAPSLKIVMKQGWDRSRRRHLTVGLLVSGTSAGAATLLGLVPPGVSNQQGPVKLHNDVLDLLLGLLINVLLVVCNQGLRQRLPDGIHLAGVSATLDADPDVNIGEP